MKTSKLSNFVSEQIRKSILSGVFEKKRKLPSERELCIKYDISRSTVRKSLTLLANQGFIRGLHGSSWEVLFSIKGDNIKNTIAFFGSSSARDTQIFNNLKRKCIRYDMRFIPVQVEKITSIKELIDLSILKCAVFVIGQRLDENLIKELRLAKIPIMQILCPRQLEYADTFSLDYLTGMEMIAKHIYETTKRTNFLYINKDLENDYSVGIRKSAFKMTMQSMNFKYNIMNIQQEELWSIEGMENIYKKIKKNYGVPEVIITNYPTRNFPIILHKYKINIPKDISLGSLSMTYDETGAPFIKEMPKIHSLKVPIKDIVNSCFERIIERTEKDDKSPTRLTVFAPKF